jgi:predicted SAM-dependent methyltransferase
MLRETIDVATQFLTWTKRRQRVIPTDAIVKVNLGSGLSVAPGWINVDGSLNALLSTLPASLFSVAYRLSGCRRWYSEEEYARILKGHRFIHHDFRYGLPFPDHSVDFLYSSHLLEHLFRTEAEKLLAEAYRVLKVDGMLRLCVPDLEYAIALYQDGSKMGALEYFFVDERTGQLGRHQYMYDFDMLRALLVRTGFCDVRRCSYRQGDVPDIDRLDNRPEETLIVEADKRRPGTVHLQRTTPHCPRSQER